jgi:hypothetical protein
MIFGTGRENILSPRQLPQQKIHFFVCFLFHLESERCLF